MATEATRRTVDHGLEAAVRRLSPSGSRALAVIQVVLLGLIVACLVGVFTIHDFALLAAELGAAAASALLRQVDALVARRRSA